MIPEPRKDMDENKYISDEDLVELLTIDALKRCVQKWGIEATEDKIKEVCSHPSLYHMRDVMLHIYNKVYKGGSK